MYYQKYIVVRKKTRMTLKKNSYQLLDYSSKFDKIFSLGLTLYFTEEIF